MAIPRVHTIMPQPEHRRIRQETIITIRHPQGLTVRHRQVTVEVPVLQDLQVEEDKTNNNFTYAFEHHQSRSFFLKK